MTKVYDPISKYREAGFSIYPPSQKTACLLVVECANDCLLRRDVATNLGG